MLKLLTKYDFSCRTTKTFYSLKTKNGHSFSDSRSDAMVSASVSAARLCCGGLSQRAPPRSSFTFPHSSILPFGSWPQLPFAQLHLLTFSNASSTLKLLEESISTLFVLTSSLLLGSSACSLPSASRPGLCPGRFTLLFGVPSWAHTSCSSLRFTVNGYPVENVAFVRCVPIKLPLNSKAICYAYLILIQRSYIISK